VDFENQTDILERQVYRQNVYKSVKKMLQKYDTYSPVYNFSPSAAKAKTKSYRHPWLLVPGIPCREPEARDGKKLPTSSCEATIGKTSPLNPAVQMK